MKRQKIYIEDIELTLYPSPSRLPKLIPDVKRPSMRSITQTTKKPNLQGTSLKRGENDYKC